MADNNRPGAEDLERFILIGRIAAGLAHELNGPIGVAIGFTELAREIVDSAGTESLDPAGTKKLTEYLSLIGDAGLRARSLTRLMWSFAKEHPGTTEDFDVTEALARASSLATPALKVAQIETRRDGPEANAVVAQADPALCVESLVALLLASPSALPDGGTVVWEATDQPNGTVGFTMRGEPWGDAGTAPWTIPEPVRRTFEAQGGTIQATERTGTHGHEVVGLLPAGDPAKTSWTGA